MKKTNLLVFAVVMIALIAISTQAYANPLSDMAAAKKNPGAHATEKSIEKTKAPKTNHGNDKKMGKGKPEMYRGTVVLADATSITLLVDGVKVTIPLGSETRIHVLQMKDGSFSDLLPGLNVMVFTRKDANGKIVTKFVQMVPGKPAKVHRVGTVTEYTPGVSITILAHDGNPYTFLLAANAKILPANRAGQLAIGSLVTIIAPHNVKTGVLLATGIVVHPAGSGSGAFPSLTPTHTTTVTATATPTETTIPTATPTVTATP